MQASFSATAPASTVSSYSFGVSTSANSTLVSSNNITNTSTPPILSASGTGSGANVVYTISSVRCCQRGSLGPDQLVGAHGQLHVDLHRDPTHDRLGK